MAIYSPQQLAAIQAFQDNALDTLSKPCKVWYMPKWVECSNCLSPVDDRYANNTGMHGGPIVTLCDMCNGTHKIQQEVTDTLNLEIDWTPKLRIKNQISVAPNIMLPLDYVLVKGYLSDAPKIIQSIKIQLNTTNINTAPIYKKLKDTLDAFNIIQDRYFLTILERVS